MYYTQVRDPKVIKSQVKSIFDEATVTVSNCKVKLPSFIIGHIFKLFINIIDLELEQKNVSAIS